MTGAVRDLLSFLYGEILGTRTYDRLSRLMADYQKRLRPPGTVTNALAPELSEKDAILFAYGDSFRCPGEPPLTCLKAFLTRYLVDSFSGVHILPFFPYSSDDGFSVIDYRSVDPRLGGWPEVEAIGERFRLMVDLVLNHVSAHSSWFLEFLRGNKRYERYFIIIPQGSDPGPVFRPRTLPLLTRFRTAGGEKLIWTTFSPDQIDLNYQHPEVLLQMVEILLTYVQKGAQLIRLDAVAFVWKKPGTSCVHLPQTHAVVRLLRAVLDAVCPWVLIVTETNVPHPQNVSYFGDGDNEAHLVYSFCLPALVLDAFRREDAGHLRAWAAGLDNPPGSAAYLNFLSSHDGIGLLPAYGYLSEQEVAGLALMVQERGGFASYRSDAAGPAGEAPYELNISFLDAVCAPGEEEELRVRKFMTSQCIMLALAGLPGVYVNSLLGAPGYPEGVRQTGMKRAINRRKFLLAEAEQDLGATESLAARIFQQYRNCLKVRRAHPAFHPRGEQKILPADGPLFSLLRISPDRRERILCIHNTGSSRPLFKSDPARLGEGFRGSLIDVLTGERVRLETSEADRILSFPVEAYQVLWLKEGG